jgi:DNA-binding transcriptional MerR regulator
MATRPKGEWKLSELAERAGVSPRTVRYYLQRGLLPQPAFRGPDTVYGDEHLVRLRAIRRMQERFLPLDAIESELARRTLGEIERIADGRDAPETPNEPAAKASGLDEHEKHERHAAVRWERFTMARGLELHLAEDADEAARALFEEVRGLIERKANGGRK